MYNYEEEMKEDILDYLECNKEFDDYTRLENSEDFEQWLNDVLWDREEITGNVSGPVDGFCSYWHDRKKAEEAIAGHLDEYVEALRGFGVISKDREGKEYIETYKKADNNISMLFEPEYIDVTLRCYYLNQVIGSLSREGLLDKYFMADIESEEK